MDQITVRHAEPDDYKGLHTVFSGPRVVAGTLQLPLLSAEAWRKRLSDTSEGTHQLVACAEDGQVVGALTLWTFPTFWRRRHVGRMAMAVGDEWQGRGIGTLLMEAALNLADNWL
jgi:putative acetyltransferase